VTRGFLEVGAAVLSLAGGLVGAYGTYLLTEWYHLFRGTGFVGSLVETVWMPLLGRKSQLIQKLRLNADFAKSLKEEDRAVSLFGVHLVLVGFGLQGIAAVLATADAILHYAYHTP
jgi:hypothetical protein